MRNKHQNFCMDGIFWYKLTDLKIIGYVDIEKESHEVK